MSQIVTGLCKFRVDRSLIAGVRVYKAASGGSFTVNVHNRHSYCSAVGLIRRSGSLFKGSPLCIATTPTTAAATVQRYVSFSSQCTRVQRYIGLGITRGLYCGDITRYAFNSYQLGQRRTSSLPCNGPVKTQEEVLSKSCGCCGLQSKVDKELSEYLTEELRIVKDNSAGPQAQMMSRLQGFEVTRGEGSSIVLTRTVENEIVTVKFNVNDSLEEDVHAEAAEPAVADHNHVQLGPMSSRPMFVVEINKGGLQRLSMACSFLSYSDELIPPGDEDLEHEEDLSLIEIQHVALLSVNEKWDENVFSICGSDARVNRVRVSGSDTDLTNTLYDMLSVMLAERGIDREFAQQLIEFSTSFEHLSYLTFLEKLRDFVNCQIE